MSTFDNIKTNLEKVSDYLNLTHGKKTFAKSYKNKSKIL